MKHLSINTLAKMSQDELVEYVQRLQCYISVLEDMTSDQDSVIDNSMDLSYSLIRLGWTQNHINTVTDKLNNAYKAIFNKYNKVSTDHEEMDERKDKYAGKKENSSNYSGTSVVPGLCSFAHND